MTGRSLVKTISWFLAVMFGTVLITMVVSSKYGYDRGSAVQTLLIIAALAWVMGRRR